MRKIPEKMRKGMGKMIPMLRRHRVQETPVHLSCVMSQWERSLQMKANIRSICFKRYQPLDQGLQCRCYFSSFACHDSSLALLLAVLDLSLADIFTNVVFIWYFFGFDIKLSCLVRIITSSSLTCLTLEIVHLDATGIASLILFFSSTVYTMSP